MVGAREDLQLRHFLLVVVIAYSQVVRGAEVAECQKDVVLFDQLTRLRRGDVGGVLIVQDYVLDLVAARDASLRVDVLEVRIRALGHRIVGRGRPGGREGAADRDRVFCDTWLRARRAHYGRGITRNRSLLILMSHGRYPGQ